MLGGKKGAPMPTDIAPSAWSVIQTGTLTDETALVQRLAAEAALDAPARAAIVAAGADLVKRIRASSRPGLMEVFHDGAIKLAGAECGD